jgi:hypothetical protein
VLWARHSSKKFVFSGLFPLVKRQWTDDRTEQGENGLPMCDESKAMSDVR